MPYYIYKITSLDDFELVRHLELLQQFDSFRPAKTEARRLRGEQALAGVSYKVIFAESQLQAEQRLLEKREKPVLMEHEK